MNEYSKGSFVECVVGTNFHAPGTVFMIEDVCEYTTEFVGQKTTVRNKITQWKLVNSEAEDCIVNTAQLKNFYIPHILTDQEKAFFLLKLENTENE